MRALARARTQGRRRRRKPGTAAAGERARHSLAAAVTAATPPPPPPVRARARTLVDAGGGAGGNCCSVRGLRRHDVALDRRVAAAVKDLAALHLDDRLRCGLARQVLRHEEARVLRIRLDARIDGLLDRRLDLVLVQVCLHLLLAVCCHHRKELCSRSRCARAVAASRGEEWLRSRQRRRQAARRRGWQSRRHDLGRAPPQHRQACGRTPPEKRATLGGAGCVRGVAGLLVQKDLATLSRALFGDFSYLVQQLAPGYSA